MILKNYVPRVAWIDFTKRVLKFTISKHRSNFLFFFSNILKFRLINMLKLIIDTLAADIKQYFQIILILAYFLDMKCLSTPTTLSVFEP